MPGRLLQKGDQALGQKAELDVENKEWPYWAWLKVHLTGHLVSSSGHIKRNKVQQIYSILFSSVHFQQFLFSNFLRMTLLHRQQFLQFSLQWAYFNLQFREVCCDMKFCCVSSRHGPVWNIAFQLAHFWSFGKEAAAAMQHPKIFLLSCNTPQEKNLRGTEQSSFNNPQAALG